MSDLTGNIHPENPSSHAAAGFRPLIGGDDEIDRLRAEDGDAKYVLHLTLTIEKLEATIAALLAVTKGLRAEWSDWQARGALDAVDRRMAAVVEGEPSVRDEPPWEHIDTKGL
jgi:hypothetical protein